MKNKILICESRSCDPYYNLALEEYLTRNVKGGHRILFLWRNAGTVVIGKNQNIYAECNINRINADGVRMARRLSGGGAVFHDTGNICFSFISEDSLYDVALHCEVIRRACAAFGIDACVTGRNDITAGGRKFSGNAFYSIGENRCHHGTVMISADTERLQNYLSTPKSKLVAKGIRSVRSAVVNLGELCDTLTPERFFAAMKNAMSEVFDAESNVIVPPDALLFEDRRAFFASDAWIYGENPPFSCELDVKTEGGRFNVKLSVKNNVTEACTIYTDSLDTTVAERIEKALVGKPFSEENVRKAVEETLQ